MVRVAHLYLIVSEYFGDVRQSIWPTLKVISLYVCKTSSTSHLASTYGPVEEESFRINFQVYQRRLCTVRLLGDNRNADVKKLQTQNKGPRREKTQCATQNRSQCLLQCGSYFL